MTVSPTYVNTLAAANSQAGTSSANASGAAAASAATSLTQLAGNFNDFLSLLTAQLKNQDPTAPMDTNQFTSQLVQFTSVAEQISTNGTLGQILTANLAQQLGQASGLIGKQVSFTGGMLPLQNGIAQLDFQTSGAQPVQISVTDASGRAVATQTVNAVSGTNSWNWNGVSDSGSQLPDGAYNVSVTGAGGAVPVQAVGTVTGADQVNQAVQLMFGTAGVTFDKVVSLN
jgi:flagellar basal-body rod modification protein FlgD